jgi:DNA-binding transcriptional LysR family regulator
LREGTLDVVFLRPGTSGTEELQLRRVSDDPIVVALPKRHPAAALEEIDLAILKDDPFCCFRGKSLRRSMTRLSTPVGKLASSPSSAKSRHTLHRS